LWGNPVLDTIFKKSAIGAAIEICVLAVERKIAVEIRSDLYSNTCALGWWRPEGHVETRYPGQLPKVVEGQAGVDAMGLVRAEAYA
jgi:hypothetical protein